MIASFSQLVIDILFIQELAECYEHSANYRLSNNLSSYIFLGCAARECACTDEADNSEKYIHTLFINLSLFFEVLFEFLSLSVPVAAGLELRTAV